MQALVTGASSGIGRSFAHILANEGYDVVLVARRKEELEDAARSIREKAKVRVQIVALDLSTPDAVDELLSRVHGDVDVLVNNAGFGEYGLFVDTDWSREESMINLNVLTLTHLAKRCAQGMVERGQGRIVNVASTAAFLPGPYMSVYYASKAFVLRFSEALAEELRTCGVSVTCLCPGPTHTGFADAAGASRVSFFQGRLPSPWDVAAYGYKSMMRGKVVAVHGWRNKLTVFFLRLLPRFLVRRLVRRRSED